MAEHRTAGTTLRRRVFGTVVLGLALGALVMAWPARALFHLAVIDEFSTSYDGDPSAQFIEIRMLAGFQTFVRNAVFAAFDANGDYIGDILVVPANVPNGGGDVRWLIGTQAFTDASGVTPDFVMPAGILPSGGGMVCFGGGGGISTQVPPACTGDCNEDGIVAINELVLGVSVTLAGSPGNACPLLDADQNEQISIDELVQGVAFSLNGCPAPAWDRTDFGSYVDCVAYGNYTGPSNVRTGNPTPFDADGHSLQRIGNTSNNRNDFDCASSLTPENNAGGTAELPATAPCPPD